jgi:hypothetical protein
MVFGDKLLISRLNGSFGEFDAVSLALPPVD